MSAPASATDAFAASSDRFTQMLAWLDGAQAAGLTHAELEDQLAAAGRDLLRQLLQDHLDLRAQRETRVAVVDTDGMAHGAVEPGHTRTLATVFGPVTVTRLAYRRRGHANLHPADAVLNLPVERHSHGLRRLAAVETTRGSFDAAVAAIGRATGQDLGKRQTEQLAARASVDIDGFYADRASPPADPDDMLVLSCDGKGIVVRPDALRPATAKAAVDTKLATRLSKARNATANAWPPSPPSTTSPRSPAPPPTSCPTPTTTTTPATLSTAAATPRPGARRPRPASGCTPPWSTTPPP